MDTSISNSPEATAAIGEAWGRTAKPGWVIGLTGELGSGKTQLVKGLARGLNIDARVRSPTFGLINIYEGGCLRLHHIDLYRLQHADDISGAGLDDYLWNPPGVTVVEWVERWLGPLKAHQQPPAFAVGPGGLRLVRIEIISENERRVHHEDFGD